MALSGYCRRHQDPTLGHRRPFELALARDMSERTAAAGAPPSPRRKLLPSSVLAVMLFFCAAAAATSPHVVGSEERGGAAEERVEALPTFSTDDNPSSCTTYAAAVARTAQQICGGALVDEALQSVQLQPEAGGSLLETTRLLARLGFRNVADLQLLAGGLEAEELMGELQAAGMSIGDRAKLRLLVGDREHLGKIALITEEPWAKAGDGQHGHHDIHEQDPQRRSMQDATADTGLSIDTIAIVLTVLVGTAGYVGKFVLNSLLHQHGGVRGLSSHQVKQ